MNLHKTPWPWLVKIEAMPKDDAVIGHYSGEFKVDAVSQGSAIAGARKQLMAKHNLKGSDFRTRTLSCHELEE